MVGDLRLAWGRSVAVLDVLERVRATGTAPELPSDVVLSLKLRLDSVLVCMMVHAVGQRRGMLRLHGDLVEVVAVLHLGQMHLLRLSCMVHVPRRWSDGRLLHVLARRCKSMMMEAVGDWRRRAGCDGWLEHGGGDPVRSWAHLHRGHRRRVPRMRGHGGLEGLSRIVERTGVAGGRWWS